MNRAAIFGELVSELTKLETWLLRQGMYSLQIPYTMKEKRIAMILLLSYTA